MINVVMCACVECFSVDFRCVSYFFFFKQKTAYEMRISDWSSDVCSSDLLKTSLQEGAIFDREAAHRLYKKLIMPALPMLTGKTHLVIIPGQITGQIPFETLVPDTGSDRFMLHDYAISYAVKIGRAHV